MILELIYLSIALTALIGSLFMSTKCERVILIDSAIAMLVVATVIFLARVL